MANAKMSHKELAAKILELVGGKQNVSSVTHCITRLRITVNDVAAIRQEEVKKLDVMGINLVGTQFPGHSWPQGTGGLPGV